MVKRAGYAQTWGTRVLWGLRETHTPLGVVERCSEGVLGQGTEWEKASIERRGQTGVYPQFDSAYIHEGTIATCGNKTESWERAQEQRTKGRR